MECCLNNSCLVKRATTPREVTPMDYVLREIEETVENYMKKWEDYLTQGRTDRHQEDFYSKCLLTETDEETRKFFESKLVALEDSRHISL